jgi:hypothetical protein
MAQFSWPKIKQGYEAMQKLYGSSNMKSNRFAYMAMLEQDKAAARLVFSSIGNDWDNTIWKTRKSFDEARAWAMN